jgi:hypothetical protein
MIIAESFLRAPEVILNVRWEGIQADANVLMHNLPKWIMGKLQPLHLYSTFYLVDKTHLNCETVRELCNNSLKLLTFLDFNL